MHNKSTCIFHGIYCVHITEMAEMAIWYEHIYWNEYLINKHIYSDWNPHEMVSTKAMYAGQWPQI